MMGNCSAAVVIPIEIEDGNPVARVRINGVVARLIVDSGGDLVSLKSAAIDRVGARRTGLHADGTNARGQTSQQALLLLDSLEIGGRSFRNVAGQESGAYAAAAAGDGVVGRQFLDQFVAVYDYRSRRIALFDSSEREAVRHACRGTRVGMLPDPEGLAIVAAAADQHELRILLDTGAVRSFIKKSFADDRKLPVAAPFYRAQTLTLGGRNVGPQPFLVIDLQAPASVDAYLGYDFFADHVVCIDPRRRVVSVRDK